MRIENHISPERFLQYLAVQEQQLGEAISSLEGSWEHTPIIRALLDEGLSELEQLADSAECPPNNKAIHERRVEKYTTWVEVMRLAAFQYGRYSSRHHSVSEGLYATLLALSAQYCRNLHGKTIAILGCGPGRSVLDFGMAYPDASVIGLDYSLLSLIAARRVLTSTSEPLQIPIRDTDGGQYSTLLRIPQFVLQNCRLGLCDLAENQHIRADLVVCSNTINLLPDHEQAVSILSEILNPGGVVIFADLVGWRLDRRPAQTVLRNAEAIQACFQRNGITTVELFSGGTYIEQETPENYTVYREHYYVGKKDALK